MKSGAFLKFECNENEELTCTSEGMSLLEQIGLMFLHMTSILNQKNANIVNRNPIKEEIESTGFNGEAISKIIEKTDKDEKKNH